MAPACPVCAEAAVIEYDSAAGNAVCTTCGYVVDENTIVADVTFGESSTGAAVLQGSSLGATDLRARIIGPRGRPQQSAESRAEMLEKGMRKLLSLTGGLKLGDSVAESAHRFFTLAVSNGFVLGKRSPYVLASCIYVACRMAKLPTMLIDISDLLQVNVFIVGATYLKLVRELCLQNIPMVDPSLYISRFASLLEFGEETHKVAYDAARLVKRFDTDWMTAGRRPAGVAGASLLIAARMNGFRRSVLEIVQVVKMADVTIKKRLEEFRATESGKMTIEEFRTVWLEKTEDPPAFTRNKRKDRAATEDGASEVGSTATESVVAKIKAFDASVPARPTLPLKRKIVDDEGPTGDERWGSSQADSEMAIEVREFGEEDAEGDNDQWSEVDRVIAQEVEAHLTSGAGSVLQNELDHKERRQREAAQKLKDAQLDDLDEGELDQFILNDREVEMKTRVWMELNHDYLQKLAEKKEKEASGEIKPSRKYHSKGKAKPRDSDNPGGATVEESVMGMINSKKKLSTRINYEIANTLFGKKQATTAKNVRPLKAAKGPTKKAGPTSKDGHVSLLNAGGGGGEDDDDEEEEEEEEEEVVDDAEFAMLKRGSMARNDDDDEGWGEEV